LNSRQAGNGGGSWAFEKIPHSVATACGKFGGFEPSNKSTVARQATHAFCEWNPADTFSGCLAAASNQLGEQSFVIPNIEQREYACWKNSYVTLGMRASALSQFSRS
jgi:hypothetical protein